MPVRAKKNRATCRHRRRQGREVCIRPKVWRKTDAGHRVGQGAPVPVWTRAGECPPCAAGPVGLWRIRQDLRPGNGRIGNGGRPSLGGLQVIRSVKKRSRSDNVIRSSTDLLNHGFGEIFTSHITMHLRSAFANLCRKSRDSGLFVNVASEVHVALIATINHHRQAECNISWHSRQGKCVG